MTPIYDPTAMPQTFNVGDRVRWINAPLPKYQNAEGIIVKILPSAALPDFTLYDVRFEFGTRSLLGNAIELVQGRTRDASN